MSVIKRNRSSSNQDLIEAIDSFCGLLETQKEDEAIVALKAVSGELQKQTVGTDSHKTIISKLLETFDEQELTAYILEKADPDEWSIAERLSMAATRVINLARRLR